MWHSAYLGAFFLALVPLAPAQRFGFVHQMAPPEKENGWAVALGDVDGDGDLDVFVGNGAFGASGSRNQLFLNDGTGILRDVTATHLPALFDGANAVALGDVDGDGDLDALLAIWGQDRLYVNDGTGVFSDVTATQFPASGTSFAAALGDVDGDGDLDAFLAFGQIRLHLNDGTGVFSDVTSSQLPSLPPGPNNWTWALALGDVDGDGDLDAFLGNGSWVGFPSPDRLYVNDGSGFFTDVSATNLPAVVHETRALALGDLDGDGDLDALVGDIISPGTRLYQNDGTGVFTDVSGTNLPAPVYPAPQAISLGDVDADGDLDALLGVHNFPNRLYLNDGSGVFTNVSAAQFPDVPDDTLGVALGDLDADGDLDAFVGNEGQDRVHLNDGSGLFVDVTAMDLPVVFERTTAAALADVDGDSDLDAFQAHDVSGQDRLYRNDGNGRFADVTATHLPPVLDATWAIAMGDVDGDGDLDAFLGNRGFGSGAQNRLYRNEGTGVFTDATATSLPVLLDETHAVALGDVDGDGDLDTFVGNDYSAAPSQLLLNNGLGAFTSATATNLPPLTLATTRAVAFGDVDGDVDLDAVLLISIVGNPAAPVFRLYLNNGIGVFTDVTASQLPPVSLLPFESLASPVLGDVDNDGDIDVVLGGGFLRLFTNDGSGLFTNVTATNLPGSALGGVTVVLGDVDVDGDLDLFVADFYQDRLYLNDGTGFFTDGTVTFLPSLDFGASVVALGDVDGDEDLDAFANHLEQDRFYTNLSRHVAWRGVPRVGKPLVFDVWGPGTGIWVLASSFGSANIFFPPFGTLRLDPVTLTLLAAGSLDPLGHGNYSVIVPSAPILVGASVYLQAVVGPPARFTNLEIATLSNL